LTGPTGLDPDLEHFCQQFSLQSVVKESEDELDVGEDNKLSNYGDCISDNELDLKESCDDLEIVEQSKLDHFNAVLQEAQRLAVVAEREKEQQ
jgi:hypothetical protein